MLEARLSLLVQGSFVGRTARIRGTFVPTMELPFRK
jgi:hypothetical protein